MPRSPVLPRAEELMSVELMMPLHPSLIPYIPQFFKYLLIYLGCADL